LYSKQTGKFDDFHFWGHLKKGIFISPQNSHPNSDMYSTLKDCEGRELYNNDLITNKSRNDGRPHAVVFSKGKFVGSYGGTEYDLHPELHEIVKVGTVYQELQIADLDGIV